MSSVANTSSACPICDFAWAKNIMYLPTEKKDEPILCEVFTYLRLRGSKGKLYRQVTRMSDGAYQRLNLLKKCNTSLFFDPKCKEISHIRISDKWVSPSSHARMVSTGSTDSIEGK